MVKSAELSFVFFLALQLHVQKFPGTMWIPAIFDFYGDKSNPGIKQPHMAGDHLGRE
jgi:hypothetical protein